MKKIFGLCGILCMCNLFSMQGMAASCDIVTNRDGLTAGLQIVGGGIGWLTGVALSPLAGIVGGVVGIGAVQIGGAYVGAKAASSIYAKDDYVCFDPNGNKCLQCDLHQIGNAYECDSDKVIIAPDFAKKCNTKLIGFDRWKDFKINICKNSQIKVMPTNPAGVLVSIDATLVKDLGRQGISGVYVTSSDVCYMLSCEKGYAYDSGKNVCVKQEQKNPDPNPTPKKSCREQHAGESKERLACCDTGSAADWTGTECKCKNSATEFKIVNGRGRCEPKKSNPVIDPDDHHTPPSKDCPTDAYPSDDNKTCICNNSAMTYDGKKCVCPSDTQKDGTECRCNDSNKVWRNDKCEYSDAYLGQIKIDIENRYSKIKSLTASFESSVWKDAEGKFNAARLASDSIAGVVLGTVGGVVTAHLVKKAQVKKGFEDMQCHIGGQPVAEYGDEFVVGR